MRSNHLHPDAKSHNNSPETAEKQDEGERLSSFETPPHSDQDSRDFSDFETSREKSDKRISGQHSRRRERNSVRVEELPLQPQKASNSDKNPQMRQAVVPLIGEQNPPKCDGKAGPTLLRRAESPQLK